MKYQKLLEKHDRLNEELHLTAKKLFIKRVEDFGFKYSDYREGYREGYKVTGKIEFEIIGNDNTNWFKELSYLVEQLNEIPHSNRHRFNEQPSVSEIRDENIKEVLK